MQERRHSQRISPKGAVKLLSVDFAETGRLANISQTGILVVPRVAAPEALLAQEATLEIRLDNAAAEWLPASGHVARVGPDGVAIVFDVPPIALERMIDEATGRSDASTLVSTVVLIDSDARRRNLMAEGFRAAGCTVIEVGSPLEAIVRLGELSFEPNVIAVADSCPAAGAQQMREFIARHHPDAQLITIGDELLEPEGIDYWLSSANPARDLAHRVHDVLVRSRR